PPRHPTPSRQCSPLLFQSSGAPLALYSFPTRRSSDLFPLRLAVIRKHKFAEHAVEVELIVNRDIPEHTLVATGRRRLINGVHHIDRKSTRLNSSHVKISYAVFCLKKKTRHRLPHRELY